MTLYNTSPSNPEAAEAAFKEAYGISKNPMVLGNIALCQIDQKRYALAVKTLERQKLEALNTLSKEDVADIDRRIGVLIKYTATLRIDVQPGPGSNATVDGAKLYVEGEEFPGTAPFTTPVLVDAKKLILTVKKDGFKDGTATVEAAAGQQDKKVSIVLEQFRKDTSKVAVKVSGPPSAVVEVDGKECGPASASAPCTAEVTYGDSHTFRARASGYSDGSKTQVISTRDLTTLALSLVPLEGRVVIDALPGDAAISIDGKPIATGRWEGVLSSSGGHQLRISKPGYTEHNVEIQVATGKTRTIQISLNQDRGKATIYAVLGAAAIIAGSAVAGGFLFQKLDPTYVNGTFKPRGTVPTD